MMGISEITFWDWTQPSQKLLPIKLGSSYKRKKERKEKEGGKKKKKSKWVALRTKELMGNQRVVMANMPRE